MLTTKTLTVALIFQPAPNIEPIKLGESETMQQCHNSLTNMTTKPHYTTCPMPQAGLKCVEIKYEHDE